MLSLIFAPPDSYTRLIALVRAYYIWMCIDAITSDGDDSTTIVNTGSDTSDCTGDAGNWSVIREALVRSNASQAYNQQITKLSTSEPYRYRNKDFEKIINRSITVHWMKHAPMVASPFIRMMMERADGVSFLVDSNAFHILSNYLSFLLHLPRLPAAQPSTLCAASTTGTNSSVVIAQDSERTEGLLDDDIIVSYVVEHLQEKGDDFENFDISLNRFVALPEVRFYFTFLR